MKLLLFRESYARKQRVSGMLGATAKTRQLLCGSGGDLRTPTSQVCRAGGYESICQRHFDRIHREDKTCSHPYNLAEAVLCINLGHVDAAVVGFKSPKAYKSWFQLEEAPRYVLLQIFNEFNLMILYFWKTDWRK